MAKSRRRTYGSKRSLPTQYATYTPNRAYTIEQLRDLIGYNRTYEISPYTRTRPTVLRRVKSQLAKTQKKSTFPKTYGVATPRLTQQETKVLDVCESRRERTQVLHALNKSGKVGQRRPIWTKKSKVRC